MGIQFLGHIERCKALVHVIDCTSNDLLGGYESTLYELQKYKETLTLKVKMIVLNKIDLLSKNDLKKMITLFEEMKINILPISTYSKYGIEDLLNKLVKIIDKEKMKTELKKDEKKWTP